MGVSRASLSSAAILLAAFALGLPGAAPAGAAPSPSPAKAPAAAASAPATPGQPDAEGRFEGLASWYGAQFHGRQTSNGEIYDKEGLTAAHRSLPFGTLLRVTSFDTGASVVVRVNDRGPFVAGRVLDLSEAAARIIGMVATGTARVSCKILPPEEAAAFGSPAPKAAPGRSESSAQDGSKGGLAGVAAGSAGGASSSEAGGSAATQAPAGASVYRIQVASYRDEKNALATLERLRMAGLAPELEVAGVYRRIVFPLVPAAEAETLAARLRAMGYRDLLVTRTLASR